MIEMKKFLKDEWEKTGFTKLTSIQEKTFTLIEAGKDIIAESPTGTGKTLAYLLPILNSMDSNNPNIQTVILAPSRELVMQIFDVAQKWAKEGKIQVASFIGGVAIARQLEKLKKKPQIVIGTPGRIEELIKQKKMKMHEVKTIILDEGDQLLLPEHMNTIAYILKSAKRDRQIVLFSATLSIQFEGLAKQWMNDPEVVRVKKEETVQSQVKHLYFVCEYRDKITLLEKLAKTGQVWALVFTKDIGNMTVLAEKLSFKNVDLEIIHGDSKKAEREAAIKGFRNEEFPILLATDVASRGLDIVGLKYVIHYDLPQDVHQYIHRSGRTGRQGASGTVISFVTTREERELKKYANDLGVEITKVRLYHGRIVEDKGFEKEVSVYQKGKKISLNKKSPNKKIFVNKK
ncbi:MAG: box helicase [Bacillales bacterium]|jgi:superfamily II DNA/RNA helicase|nr:box helicase [Bacillales bacterium]